MASNTASPTTDQLLAGTSHGWPSCLKSDAWLRGWRVICHWRSWCLPSRQLRVLLQVASCLSAVSESIQLRQPVDDDWRSRSWDMTADRTLETASSCSPHTRVCAGCVERTRGTWMATFPWRQPCLSSCMSLVLRSAQRAFRASTPCCRGRPRLCTPSCWRPLPTRAGARLQRRPNHGCHRLWDGGDAWCDGHVWAAGARAGLLLPPLREHVEVCPGSGADRHVQHRRRRLALRRDASATSATGNSAREWQQCQGVHSLALLPVADVPAGMANHRANTPSTSTTSSTTLMPRTSLDDTASFSLPPSTPPRPYHQPGSDDSRPCSPQTCGTSTTVTGADRTNNMCESWNSAFQRLVGHQHQGEWTLLRCLRKDAAVVSTLIVQESRGMPPRKRQKHVYIDLQASLKYLCDARAAGRKTLEEMLEGVGHLIWL